MNQRRMLLLITFCALTAYGQDCTTSDYVTTRSITLNPDGADPNPGCVKPGDNLSWDSGPSVKNWTVIFQKDHTPLSGGKYSVSGNQYDNPAQVFAVDTGASGQYDYAYTVDNSTPLNATIKVGTYASTRTAAKVKGQPPITAGLCPDHKNKSSQSVKVFISGKKLFIDVDRACLASGGYVKWSTNDPKIMSFTVRFGGNGTACGDGCTKMTWKSDFPPVWLQVYYCKASPLKTCSNTPLSYTVVAKDVRGKTYRSDPDIIIDAAIPIENLAPQK